MSTELKPGQQDLLRHRRLLIVEDNAGDRFLYKQMLAEADPGTEYHFDEVETGALALERVAEEEADCILLDFLLPDMLGTELLAALAEQMEVVPPVVMLTGFGDEATAVRALQGGAHGYLPKRELKGEALSQAIDRAVRASGSQRKLEQARLEIAERNRELEQKYQQIENFYRKILGRLQLPASTLRDHLAAFAVSRGSDDKQQFAQEVKKLQAESEQLVLALGNLIDNPGTNLGQLLISTQPATIMEVVLDAVNAFRPVADAAGTRLFVLGEPGLPEVEIDRYRIEQVLSNLLDNAVRHTQERGRIVIKVDRLPGTPQEITIAVSDTGSGMATDRLAGLFERPKLQDMASDEGSLGCGLYLCKEILQAHKGRISVESQPGKGTCITFTLPLKRGPATASEVWKQTESRNGGSLNGWDVSHTPGRHVLAG